MDDCIYVTIIFCFVFPQFNVIAEEYFASAWIMNTLVIGSDDQNGKEAGGVLNPVKDSGVGNPYQFSLSNFSYSSSEIVPLKALMS